MGLFGDRDSGDGAAAGGADRRAWVPWISGHSMTTFAGAFATAPRILARSGCGLSRAMGWALTKKYDDVFTNRHPGHFGCTPTRPTTRHQSWRILRPMIVLGDPLHQRLPGVSRGLHPKR